MLRPSLELYSIATNLAPILAIMTTYPPVSAKSEAATGLALRAKR